MADGGCGKTAIRMAQMLAMATGREITGEHVFQRCRVLMITLEDDAEELKRRLMAAMKHHGVAHDELDRWFYYAALGGLGIKFSTPEGRMPTVDLSKFLSRAIEENQIDVICLDPFIKSHSATENDNNAIDHVAGILASLAVKYHCAVDAPHHMSKGAGDPGNANRGRGASAFKDAARLVYTATVMTYKEANDFGIIESERRSYVRVDSGKLNITASGGGAMWYRLTGVMLGNCTETYPNGDNVQTVIPWTPPERKAEESFVVLHSVQQQIFADIDEAAQQGNPYTHYKTATTRHVYNLFQKHIPSNPGREITKEMAEQKVQEWLDSCQLKERDDFKLNGSRSKGLTTYFYRSPVSEILLSERLQQSPQQKNDCCEGPQQQSNA
jgi:hypothetical protein